MKRLIAILLVAGMLSGCAAKESAVPETTVVTEPVQETVPVPTYPVLSTAEGEEIAYVSHFDTVTEIILSEDGVTGNPEGISISNDIIYYEDRENYESGNPYGEGEAHERHPTEEAADHTVVNITAPGAYRVTGKLSKGQIRIDLGEEAYHDPNAVVELILKDADITCTVAPAILFANVYECDGEWSADTAKPDVDTSAAGANLILEGSNVVNGSHVVKIFKDKEGEKKLWKQDGALYSYMSMNVFGPGKLDITADNEGLDSELHLTINGGQIAIRADNDGINTNEDGVSVTTINGGSLHIMAGLGAEGDGIDSNGYLVINGGTVVSSAHLAADAGLDSDLGSFIHGGTVIALGSTMDWAESDSAQVTMNLQFASTQSSDAAVVVTREDGTILFAYDPSADEVLADNRRSYSGAVVSCPNFHVGETYHVYVDGEVTGEDLGGLHDPVTITSYLHGTQMAYTGTDVIGRPGGMGFGGEPPKDFDPGKMPEGFAPGQIPEGFDPNQRPDGKESPAGMEAGQPPEGFTPERMPEEMPGDFEPGQMPEGMEFPGGIAQTTEAGEPNSAFYMQDKVNFFSGLQKA